MTTLKVPGFDYDTASLEAFCERWGVVRLGVFGTATPNKFLDRDEIGVMVKFREQSDVSAWDMVTMEEELAGLLGRAVRLYEDGAIENPFRLRAIERDLTPVYAA